LTDNDNPAAKGLRHEPDGGTARREADQSSDCPPLTEGEPWPDLARDCLGRALIDTLPQSRQ
jgi:hypothetical protein